MNIKGRDQNQQTRRNDFWRKQAKFREEKKNFLTTINVLDDIAYCITNIRMGCYLKKKKKDIKRIKEDLWN